MGNAEFCPVCGDIVGGWDLPFQPHTCKGQVEVMATEGGADLREVIARQAFFAVGNHPAVDDWYAVADAILAAIAEAGYVVVERGRLERLRKNAWAYRENRERWYADQDVCVHPGNPYELLPGDLDGPGGGAG